MWACCLGRFLFDTMRTVDEGGFSGRDHIDHDVALQCLVREPLFFCSHVFITKLNHRYFFLRRIFILFVFVWCCRFFWFSASSTTRCVDVFFLFLFLFLFRFTKMDEPFHLFTLPTRHSVGSVEKIVGKPPTLPTATTTTPTAQQHESVFFTLSITRAVFKWQCMRQIISNIIDFSRLFVSLPDDSRREETRGTHAFRWRCWQREIMDAREWNGSYKINKISGCIVFHISQKR